MMVFAMLPTIALLALSPVSKSEQVAFKLLPLPLPLLLLLLLPNSWLFLVLELLAAKVLHDAAAVVSALLKPIMVEPASIKMMQLIFMVVAFRMMQNQTHNEGKINACILRRICTSSKIPEEQWK